MSDLSPKILITGASGQLGGLVIEALLQRIPAHQVIATARDPHALAHCAAKGVNVRPLDYTQPLTIRSALAGVDRVLLISSNAIGQRVPQHQAVINAAREAGIGFFAYTSVLHAPECSLRILRDEHTATEEYIRESGLQYAFLRNGWYFENYTQSIASVLEHGAVIGCAGDGRISAATRKDYAHAAAVVLTTSPVSSGQVLELAGDVGFTLAQYAAEIAEQTGRQIVYHDVSEAQYIKTLQQAGLPEGIARFVAEADTAASKGALFDQSNTLHRLLQAPTTTLKQAVANALKAVH